MPSKFVDRERELNRLASHLERVRRGAGRVVLVEGPAGIGKSALVDRFLESAGDAEILKAKAKSDAKFQPYYLFQEALKSYGDLKSIKDKQEWRKIADIAQDLIVRPRMVMVDEIENGGGFALYRVIRSELDGVYFSVRMPREEDGIWITETRTDKRRVKPSSLEFDFTPAIYDFVREDGEKVVLIDDVNYLIYLNGIDRVVEFLHTIYSATSGRHVVIVSGRTEQLSDEEKNKLFSCFDEIISLEVARSVEESTFILVDAMEAVDSKNVVVFSSRKGAGDYVVGESPLDPHRLDFEIFETVAKEIEKGHDVVLDCISYLVHYNGFRKVYTWLKSVADVADKNGARVYVVTKGLSEHHVDILRNLADESRLSRHVRYEEVSEVNAIKFYDSILNFLDYNSKKRVVILVLEDLQWADKSSLELLRYLARNIGKSRILLIGTYRGSDMVSDEEAADIMEDIHGFENVHLIRLRGMDRDSLAALLRNEYEDVTDGEIDKVYEKSEGNPLLALSIMEHMRRTAQGIPETIRESVELQLEAMDDRTLHFLGILSVIGEEAPVDIVKEMYPRWRDRLKKVEGKFVELVDGVIRFRFSIYRDIVYRHTSKDTRLDIHRRLAEIYERRGNVVEAAKHYYLAGDMKALDLLKRASEESLRNMAIRDAIDYCKMALEIAEKYRKRGEIAKIYERIGDLYRMVGEYRKAIDMFEKAIKEEHPRKVSVSVKIASCYESLGLYDKALLILTKYREVARGLERGKIAGKIGVVKWHLGDFDEAKIHLEEYLKVAKKYRSYEDISEAYRNLAIVDYYLSQYDDALKKAQEALKNAIESGRYDLIANAYNVIGVIYNRKNMVDEALQYFKKYLEIVEKLGNYDYISKAYNNLALVYDYKGDYEKAKNYYLLSLEMNFKLGNKRDLSISYNNLAVVESENGDAMKAIEYLKKSLKYAEEIGDTYNLCGAYLNLGSFYMQIRYYEDARRCLQKAIRIAKNENYFSSLISGYLIMAEVCMEESDLKCAGKYIKLAEKTLENVDDMDSKLAIVETKSEYMLLSGKINEAENLLEEAISLAEEMGDQGEIERLDVLRGRIRCARGDYSNATIYFERAIEREKKKNKKKWIAEIYRIYAECLEKFNVEEAKKYYRYAHTLYKDLNNRKWAEEIERRLEKL